MNETPPRLDQSAVVRRIASDMTHVARIGPVRRASFIEPYWAPALYPHRAACGVQIPTTSVVMATGTVVRCRTCIHLTGITEQSPAIHERLDDLLPLS
jgi:hypothetical protein